MKEGAVAASSPAAVLAACDVTFAMLSDPAAAEAVVFGPGGVLEGVKAGKGYVDMSTGAALEGAGAAQRTRRSSPGGATRTHAATLRSRAAPRPPRTATRHLSTSSALAAAFAPSFAQHAPSDPWVLRRAVDAETSRKIGAAITAKGGRFLEAPVSGSKKPAIGTHCLIRSHSANRALIPSPPQTASL